MNAGVYDKEATKEKILQALESLILHGGFTAVGVNAVARKAGVSKVLIYRYFGNLDGLISAFALRVNPFDRICRDLEDLLSRDESISMRTAGMFIFSSFVRQIDDNPLFAQILRWEMVDDNNLTREICRKREESGVLLLGLLENYFPEIGRLEIDLPALTALLNSGLSYLLLRKDQMKVYNGVPLDTEEGPRRLLGVIDSLFKLVL